MKYLIVFFPTACVVSRFCHQKTLSVAVNSRGHVEWFSVFTMSFRQSRDGVNFHRMCLEVTAVMFCYLALAEPSSAHTWYLSSTLSAHECVVEWTEHLHSEPKGHVFDYCQTYVSLPTKYCCKPLMEGLLNRVSCSLATGG